MPREILSRGDRSEVPAGEPLLLGRLHLDQLGPETRPRLEVSAWCPYCHACHPHPWPDPPVPLDHAVEVEAGCRVGTPLRGGSYWVALDPLQRPHAAHIARLADAAFAAWDRRQAAREAQANGH